MHSDHRPDPDAVLAKVAAESSSTGEGRLKIFFGYAAGVGKTFAMLAAAQVARREGREVVVGYVEPHARPETEALLEGFEILPRRQLRHRDIALQEFDLDAALARHPALLLVDELAHSNEDGCRHPKRWQDVAELLAAGISVYTTLNVQHLDSLNDVVARITGVLVRETVPDDAVDRADEIELVDLPPDELLERFRRGRVYLPEQAVRAAERFFKKDTLVALRELALRKMAEHVHRQVELGRRSLAARPIWATQHRLLVAVGPSPSSARLVRATRRLATELRAPWYAVAVQDPARIERDGEPRTENLARNLRLAEQLGAEVVTLVDADIPGALVSFAHDRGVTRLVVGKTAEPAWKRLLRPTILDAVTRRSGELEILVISGDAPDAATPAPGPQRAAGGRLRGLGRHLGVVAGVLALATVAGFGLRALAVNETNIVALFVLAVAVAAYATNRQASIVAALGAVLLFNFFFTVPFYTLAVADPGYLVTFAVMLLIGLAISALVGRVRAQAAAARQRADANDILYRVSQALAAAPTRHQVAAETQRRLEQLLGGEAAVLMPDASGEGLGEAIGAARLISDPRERAVADWAFRQRRPAGAGTDTLPAAAGLYLPLLSRDGTRFGLLAVAGPNDGPPARERRQILDSIAALAAQALERCALEESARRSHATAEAERLRSDLLATVSHDLRTPLAAISGAMAAVLGSPRSTLSAADRQLLLDVVSEAGRISRLVEKLLQLGRLQEGRAPVNPVWIPIEEPVAEALRQVAPLPGSEAIAIDLGDDAPLAWCDGALLAQALANLLENALLHGGGEGEGAAAAGEAAAVALTARREAAGLRIEVLDRGPGFPAGDRERLFTRFVRGDDAVARATQGSGLGLAICRAVAQAHGGSIEAGDRAGGGACLRLWLPDPPDRLRPTAEDDPDPEA
jgi:two-component system sensor histidine kinase KdpD